MKKRLLVLTTGGTIASRATAEGLAPDMSGGELAGWFPAGVAEHYEIRVLELLHMDSSNIQPEEWRLIAQTIYDNISACDGIVITHGTDTMAYTASVLSFMLRNLPIPVVLTGSQLPADHPMTDAMENLRTAFAMASSGAKGVFIAFNRKVLLGCRAVKTHTMDFDAFESVNYPPVAYVDGKGLTLNTQALPPIADAPCRLHTELEQKVFLIKLTPGFDPEVLDMLADMHYRGIVIEAFGAGGLHFVRRDLVAKLQKAAQRGITVVVCSQCLYEPSDFSLYQVGQMALKQGVLESRDMTTEAAVTKLMWVLGQTTEPEEIRRLFTYSISGEISEESQERNI